MEKILKKPCKECPTNHVYNEINEPDPMTEEFRGELKDHIVNRGGIFHCMSHKQFWCNAVCDQLSITEDDIIKYKN